jgi:NH3-dependent NAD+ synthetase
MGQIAPGHTYEEVDDILNTYIQAKANSQFSNLNSQINEAVERLNAAYGAETVERVLKRHRNSEFKRKRMPIAIPRSLYE